MRVEGQWRGKVLRIEGQWRGKVMRVEGQWRGKVLSIEGQWRGKVLRIERQFRGKVEARGQSEGMWEDGVTERSDGGEGVEEKEGNGVGDGMPDGR